MVAIGHLPKIERPRQLLGKVVEELQELAQSEGDAQLAELADIYELLNSYLMNLGYDWTTVAATAAQKTGSARRFRRWRCIASDATTGT